MLKLVITFLLAVAAVSALPHDQVIRKLDNGLRHQYIQGPDGTPHLVDLWMKTSDVTEAARYHPDTQNIYHLFTRDNPSISQVLILGDTSRLANSNFDPSKRTIFLIHGWMDTVTSPSNSVLVPAFLEGEDLNVIVVDWSAGSSTLIYTAAVINTPISGRSVAGFITWLIQASGANLRNYHLVGHGLGGHQAGIVGRNLDGQVAYITALDPSFAGWVTNDDKFSSNDGVYTEVIHTNAGLQGYLATLGQVDFYPNGGIDMPGCISPECDHARAYFYMAESIRSGGFTGSRCSTYVTAMAGQCYLWGNLQMGGLTPKTGSSGIYYLRTFALPPFSRG